VRGVVSGLAADGRVSLSARMGEVTPGTAAGRNPQAAY